MFDRRSDLYPIDSHIIPYLNAVRGSLERANATAMKDLPKLRIQDMAIDCFSCIMTCG
jgi:hypothetical protein